MLDKNFFKALAIMVGTIIGVGIFTIPFVVVKSGLIPFLILLPLLAFVQHLFHRYYADIIIATGEKHRLPGYVEKYFGPKSKIYITTITLVGVYGSLLAYTIVGGIFAHGLLGNIFGGSVFIYSIILFFIQSFVVLYGLKLISRVESYLTVLLLATILVIIWKSFGLIDVDNFTAISWPYLLLPYGPIFFSVGGDAAIPEVCRLLNGRRDDITKAIRWGTYIPAVITGLFAIGIIGATGALTTSDTLSGLNAVFSSGMMKIALALGLLSVITSFITLMQATKEIFYWDLKISKKISWVLAMIPPFVLFLFGAHNLTKVVSFTGAVAGGLIGIIFIWLFYKVKNGSPNGVMISSKMNKKIAIILSIFFIIGFIYSLFELL
jgi:tyrosine-specific transport protein